MYMLIVFLFCFVLFMLIDQQRTLFSTSFLFIKAKSLVAYKGASVECSYFLKLVQNKNPRIALKTMLFKTCF